MTDAYVEVHNRFMAKAARQISSLWRYIVIDGEGNTQKNPLMDQSDLFRMFPEVAEWLSWSSDRKMEPS
jgi:hypothetical protein